MTPEIKKNNTARLERPTRTQIFYYLIIFGAIKKTHREKLEMSQTAKCLDMFEKSFAILRLT